MKRLLIISLGLLLAATFSSCRKREKILYQSPAFIIYSDRVVQDTFIAKALSETHMVTSYQSPEKQVFSPLLQFKFSINGKDNELDFNVNHEADLTPNRNQPVVINAVFGKRSELSTDHQSVANLPENTEVQFNLDMRPVLNSFKTKGYYEDIHGNKIYRKDFKGVYIAGSAYPLNWDFENLPNNKQLELTDPDGDSIYSVQLVFNAFDPDAHVRPEWKLKNDISQYPVFTSESPLLNAIYNLSLDELKLDIEADSTFRTGDKWGGVWTRDISYSIILSLAILEPEVAKISLMKKVKDGHIIQDTGTGGAWPVSSDRVVWSLAAWEIYKTTGDRDWLKLSYEIVRNSVKCDQRTIVDPATGLRRGESSFLDWRKQTYPRWMQPVDIYASMNLGTNAVHYQTLKVLGKMANELGETDSWTTKADSLKQNINTHLWETDKGYYGQYLYGRNFFSLSTRSESLGEALTLLFGIADSSHARSVLENTPLLPYGIPCIYPQIPGISPYHNDASWPFVQAFWTMAAAKEKQQNMVAYSYATQLRAAALFLTNKENMVAETGDFAGTVLNSSRQLWSIAGQLAMTYRIIFGITPGTDSLRFHPVIPEHFGGTYHLDNFHYRKSVLSLTVSGFGNAVSSFKLDGKLLPSPVIPSGLTGKHNIGMVMNNHPDGPAVKMASFITGPETPEVEINGNVLRWKSISGAVKYRVIKDGKTTSEITDTASLILEKSVPATYQVEAVAEDGTPSFLSQPVEIRPTSSVIVIQAEHFNYPLKKEVSGYSGEGYVDFNLKNNQPFSFLITIPTNGIYQFCFRYANGSGPVNTDNKCGIRSFYIDNQFHGSLVFPQRGKNEWSDWGWSNTAEVKLKKGTHQFRVQFDNCNTNMNGEVNRFLLDEIQVIKIPE